VAIKSLDWELVVGKKLGYLRRGYFGKGGVVIADESELSPIVIVSTGRGSI